MILDEDIAAMRTNVLICKSGLVFTELWIGPPRPTLSFLSSGDSDTRESKGTPE